MPFVTIAYNVLDLKEVLGEAKFGRSVSDAVYTMLYDVARIFLSLLLLTQPSLSIQYYLRCLFSIISLQPSKLRSLLSYFLAD